VLDIVSKGRFVGWHVTVSDRDDIMVDQTLIPVTSVERIPGSIPTTAVVDWLQPKVDRLTAPDRLAAVDAELHSGKRMSETRFTALRVERMQLTNLLAR
jgi:hypothetical protein